MPAPSTLLLVALASLALILLPGPNVVYIATRSLSYGRRVGLASMIGIECGILVHVTAATLGLSALIRSSTIAFDVVKYLGVGYLVFLGVRSLVRGHPLELTAEQGMANVWRTSGEGVLISVLNPKVALFFVAFLPQFVDPSRGSDALQILVLGLIFVTIASICDLVWALSAGTLGRWLRERPRFAQRQHYLMGGVYLALGVVAALTGAGHQQR